MHDTSSALSAFDIAAILVVASALLGWFNHHFIKLPHVIGLTVMGALTAIGGGGSGVPDATAAAPPPPPPTPGLGGGGGSLLL